MVTVSYKQVTHMKGNGCTSESFKSKKMQNNRLNSNYTKTLSSGDTFSNTYATSAEFFTVLSLAVPCCAVQFPPGSFRETMSFPALPYKMEYCSFVCLISCTFAGCRLVGPFDLCFPKDQWLLLLFLE